MYINYVYYSTATVLCRLVKALQHRLTCKENGSCVSWPCFMCWRHRRPTCRHLRHSSSLCHVT